MLNSAKDQLLVPEIGVVLLSRRRGLRNITLRYDSKLNLPKISAPYGVPKQAMIAFVLSRQDWLNTQATRSQTDKRSLAPGDTIPILGVPTLLCHDRAAKGAQWGEGTLTLGGDVAFFNKRLATALKQRVQAHISQKSAQLAAGLGLKPAGVRVRELKSCWGSCATNRMLSFNWRLVFAPLFVLDYVIAHEVAHLKVHKHNAAFWAVVAGLDPAYQQAELWLKQQGRTVWDYQFPG